MKFEDNMKATKEISDIAHTVNVSVEGEMALLELWVTQMKAGKNITYTNPKDVVTFVDYTNVDALAVAIGTAHGIYPKNFKPELQFDLLKEINKITSILLVLHGGSDNPDEEIRKACKIGIQKVNISSDIKQEFFKTVYNL